MNVSNAMYQFWSSFGLDAYELNSVPTGENKPSFPYITYEMSRASINEPVPVSASLWYRSPNSWKAADDKAEEIDTALQQGGVTIKVDDGYVWFTRGRPTWQHLEDEDPTIRRIMFNLMVEYLTS